jgi:hypothetical protein
LLQVQTTSYATGVRVLGCANPGRENKFREEEFFRRWRAM